MNISSEPGIVRFPLREQLSAELKSRPEQPLPKRDERSLDDERRQLKGIDIDLDAFIKPDSTFSENGLAPQTGPSEDARVAPPLVPETHPTKSQDDHSKDSIRKMKVDSPGRTLPACSYPAIDWTTIDKTVVRCSPEVYYSSVWDFSSSYRNSGGAR
jgi:hypothetical protein